jgi:hypothetical protein
MNRAAAAPETPARAYAVGFWIAAVVGGSVAGYGVAEYLAKYPDLTRRVALARWIVGVNIAHDLLLAPLVLLVGVGVRRLIPRVALGPAQFGLMASGIVLLIAWRPLQRSAAYKHNATAQPLDYTAATLTVLAVVWMIAAAWVVVRIVRR